MAIDPYYSSDSWKILRTAVLQRDHHRCSYCGGDAFQADHITARSKGGKDELDNLVAACSDCNHFLGGRYFATFAEKWIFYQAHAPLRKKRAEGKVKLQVELEKLKWRKASLTITNDERRQLRRKLVSQGYFFKFRIHPYFCLHCHATSKEGARWTSPSCCPGCARDIAKENAVEVFAVDAAVRFKMEVIEQGDHVHCPQCDAVSQINSGF